MTTTSKPKKPRNWHAIIARTLGGLLVFTFLVTGCFFWEMLLVGFLLIVGFSITEMIDVVGGGFKYTPNERRLQREARRRAAELLGPPAAPEMPPEEFFKSLEEQERQQS